MIVIFKNKQLFYFNTFFDNSHIASTLRYWQKTKSLVIIKSSSDKIFCCGGDLHQLLELPLSQRKQYFNDLYCTLHLIASYRIPYVSLINGLTMGAGAGISINGTSRVATENTVFAMPETKIALIPGVGSGHFLSKLPGQLGMYIGMSGASLKGRIECWFSINL